ncbi:beta catenin antagonist chibby isoform X2 [Oratosquilla oratoria]|uniref:beta catenin antagonist chibby isoform X2 n=1 Tax=Oratosquilla oratoria TaxID=337810 RepID=UPI003F765F43
MPLNLFGSKFSPGKAPPRRSLSLSSLRRESDKSGRELSQDFNEIKINLGGQEATFNNGEWIASSHGKASSREVARLRQQNSELQEENNLLKLKVELLIDMLTEKSADALIKGKEIQHIRSSLRR